MGKWILAFLIAAAVLFLCWKLRGVMLTPVCRGKGQSLELILRVSGASPELEATVDGLLWLINDGVLLEGSCCWTTAWTRKQEKSPGGYRWDRGM